MVRGVEETQAGAGSQDSGKESTAEQGGCPLGPLSPTQQPEHLVSLPTLRAWSRTQRLMAQPGQVHDDRAHRWSVRDKGPLTNH